MNTSTIFLLIILFSIKHFIADFPLQTKYMLGKFKETGWVLPLLSHVAVHGLFTFLITCYFGFWQAIGLACFNSTMHFIMDRIKASPKLLGRFQTLTKDTYLNATEEQKRNNWWFWITIGGDQLWHGLTDIISVAWLVFN